MAAVMFFLGMCVGLVCSAGIVWYLARPRKPKDGDAVSMTDVYRQSKQEIDKIVKGLDANEIVGWEQDEEDPNAEAKPYLYRKNEDGSYRMVRELTDVDFADGIAVGTGKLD